MSWSERVSSVRPLARRAALPCILLIALALRLYRLGSANLWWDEALAVWAVRKGLAGVTLWTASDVHPPLFFWSLWTWVQVAGESEFAMRLLSALFGVLTVYAVYRLGHLLGGRQVGLLASLLTALSRFHVWWSQELRMYVLAGLLGVLSLYYVLRWLAALRVDTPEPSAKDGDRLLAWYTLSTLGALYTIFLSGAWVLVENAVVLGILLFARGYHRGRLLGRWILSQAAIAVVLGAWLLVSWDRMSSWSVAQPVSPGFVARLYAILLTAGASVDIDRYLWTTILPLFALIVGVVLLVRRMVRSRDGEGGTALAVVLLSVAVPPLVVFISTLPRSLFYTPHIEARYFLPFAPAFWLLLAWAVVEIGRRRRWAGNVVATGLIASWLIVLPGHYADRHLADDYRTMVRAIVSQSEPGDIVLLDSGSRYPLFLYPYERLPAAQLPDFDTITPSSDLLTVLDVEIWLARNAESYGRIWLAEVDVNLSDPDRVLRQVLDRRYGLDWAEGYGHNTLQLFAPGEVAPSLADGYRPERQGDSDASTWGVRGWEVPVDRYTRGDPIWIALYWDWAQPAPQRLELVSAEGIVVAGRSVGLTARQGPARERVELPVTAALTPGAYRLRLADSKGHLLRLGNVYIAGTPAMTPPGGPAVVVDATVDESVTLDGYTLVDAPATGAYLLHPGDEVSLDLYWRATGVPQRTWTVFTHLVGEAYNPATSGPVWGQQDSVPAEGQWPTTTWQAGDSGIDRHIIRIDPEAPDGDYVLSFGMYDGISGARADISIGDSAAGNELTVDRIIRVVSR